MWSSVGRPQITKQQSSAYNLTTCIGLIQSSINSCLCSRNICGHSRRAFHCHRGWRRSRLWTHRCVWFVRHFAKPQGSLWILGSRKPVSQKQGRLYCWARLKKKGANLPLIIRYWKSSKRIFISIRSKRKMVLEAAALVWLLATLRGRQDFRTLSYSNIQQHQSSADMPSNVHDMRGTEYIHSCSMRCLKSLIKNRVNATRQPNAMLAMLRWKRTRTHPCSGGAGNLAMGLGQARPSWLQWSSGYKSQAIAPDRSHHIAKQTGRPCHQTCSHSSGCALAKRHG